MSKLADTKPDTLARRVYDVLEEAEAAERGKRGVPEHEHRFPPRYERARAALFELLRRTKE